MPEWEADIQVGEDLVRALLAEQFPALDVSSLQLLGEGWDNSVWLVEERLAFRFPRRGIAIPGVEREVAVLPRLAPLLPVAVPTPTYVGEPSERYPWPFFGCPVLRGVEPADTNLPEDARASLGGDLGRFLKQLHDPATHAAVDPHGQLPVDFNRRADMPFRVERTRDRLEALDAAGLWRDSSAGAVLEEAERLGSCANLALAHGDLHLRHVLVEDGGLSGVIDWGDVCIADPAIDLVLYWSLLGPEGRGAFLDAYGEIGEEGLLRARVLSLFLCAILALYAHDVGHGRLQRECVAGLERTLVD